MRRFVLVLLWMASDLLLFLASYALAYFIRVGFIFSTDFPFGSFLLIASAVAPFWLLTLICTRTFALTRNQRSLRTFGYILYAGIVGTALFAVAYYFFYGLFFSRFLLLCAAGFSVIIPWIWHVVMGRILRIAVRRSPPLYPTLIIGATRESAALIRALQTHRNPLTPVAILDGHGAKEKMIEDVPVLGKLNILEDTIQKFGITHLVQCSDIEQSINLLSACRSHGITYLLLPSVLGIVERDERVESLEGQPVTAVRPGEPAWKWFFS